MSIRRPENSVFRRAATFVVLVLFGCASKTEPNADNFTRGVKQYLEVKGDFCLGKTTWPIDVTQPEFDRSSRDAVQMPVLEKLGLVSGSDVTLEIQSGGATVELRARRYTLTPEGLAFYRSIPARTNAAGKPIEKDFCAAKLGLDKIVGWELSEDSNGARHSLVRYTFTVDPVFWAKDPEIERVFPMLARIVHGERRAELVEAFTLTREGWTPDDLVGSRTPEPRSPSTTSMAENR